VPAVASLPVGEKWAFELKLDGYRCIAVKHGKEVTVFSRHERC
jgi:ATP-dependent DNA ligase